MKLDKGVTPEMIRAMYSRRNPAIVNVLQFFSDAHHHPEIQDIVRAARGLAFEMVDIMPDGPELTVGLRHLMDAKSAFVRQYQMSSRFNLANVEAPKEHVGGDDTLQRQDQKTS